VIESSVVKLLENGEGRNMEMKNRDRINQLLEQLGQVLLDKPMVLEYLLAGFLAGGHVLIEDVPGVGKTSVAKAFAASLGLKFGRIQFTPDLLPGDITGTTILDPATSRFFFRKGPVFNQIVLADEINRSSPKTQSSLLQAMEEREVSFDDQTYLLPIPFMVIATQNPVEYQGTFPLPEAQLDRFLMCLKIGYPGYLKELDIAAARQRTAAQLQALVTEDELLELFQNVAALVVAPEILQYAVNITTATRANPDFVLGASPRASMDLVKAGRALAYIRQRDYVIPDDIKELAPWILGHRLILSAEARMEKKDVYRIITQLLKQVHVPKNISLA